MVTARRYRLIVGRFEDIARASLGKPQNLMDICAALAIGQGTLARAVRTVRGTTPTRYLRGLALGEARAALRDPATRSVRQVALRYGFRELGRFAADYRAAFGENPSDTLRRNSAAGSEDDVRDAACEARRRIPAKWDFSVTVRKTSDRSTLLSNSSFCQTEVESTRRQAARIAAIAATQWANGLCANGFINLRPPLRWLRRDIGSSAVRCRRRKIALLSTRFLLEGHRRHGLRR